MTTCWCSHPTATHDATGCTELIDADALCPCISAAVAS